MPETNITRAIVERPFMLLHDAGEDATRVRKVVLVFGSPQNAERLVAGVPAVARAVREVALAGMDECLISTEEEWRPSGLAAAEIERLACGMPVALASTRAAQLAVAFGAAIAVSGEQLCGALQGEAERMLKGRGGVLALTNATSDCFSASGDLDLAERRILLATAKPGDGLVSRTLNRPISRLISRLLLRLPAIRPIHGTMVTAALGIAMCVAFIAGGAPGLLIGAFLFQAASILDGVDGEMARATFRASRLGAKLDSLVDMATNIGFIGGVVANLWLAGSVQAAAIGLAGLVAMSLGLVLLGVEAGRSSRPFTFDLVKEHLGQRPSALRKGLTWLTMRDFYAFAGFLFVATGHAAAGLVSFAAIALGWFGVVCVVLARRVAMSSPESALRETA